MVVEADSEEKYNPIFRALANEHRRRILQYVVNADEPVTVEGVAIQLTEWEDELTILGNADVKNEEVEAALYHVHLPEMAEAGLLEYDPSSEEIEHGEYSEEAWAQVRAMQE